MLKQNYLPSVHCYRFHLSRRRGETFMYVHACSHACVQIYGDPFFFSNTHTHKQAHCGSDSVFPSACRPPVPLVIHEPSAWTSAVSDVCQTGPHLSPPPHRSCSNCVLVCMPKPSLKPLQHSMVSQGTPARLSGPSCPK